MSGFEPGEGWREIDVSSEEAAVHAVYQLAEYDEHTGALKRAWVRVPPVPPLPTEPYTAIEVTWKEGSHNNYRPTKLSLTEKGLWRTLEGQRMEFEPAWFGVEVERFEVLAEPRAVTAKAVLDRVLHLDSWSDGIPIRNIEALARELGAES